MPLFEFSCPECGLTFEKIVPMGTTTHECLACKAEAHKGIPEVAFKFASGKTPGNSGVDSLDSSVDKGVGRDAEKRWEHVKDRESNKRKIRREAGMVQRDFISQDYVEGDAEYISKARSMQEEYHQMYKEHVQERKKKGIPKFNDSIERFKNRPKK